MPKNKEPYPKILLTAEEISIAEYNLRMPKDRQFLSAEEFVKIIDRMEEEEDNDYRLILADIFRRLKQKLGLKKE